MNDCFDEDVMAEALVEKLKRLPRADAERLMTREFEREAVALPPKQISAELLRLTIVSGPPHLAYLAGRILARRTDAPADWLALAMAAGASGRYDAAQSAAMKAIELAGASGDSEVVGSAERWLSALVETPVGRGFRCVFCELCTYPVISLRELEGHACHSCARRIGRLALDLDRRERAEIWNLSDEEPVSERHLPLLGREVAAESLASMGHLSDAVSLAAHALELDDADTSARALNLLLGPQLARENAPQKLRQLLGPARTA